VLFVVEARGEGSALLRLRVSGNVVWVAAPLHAFAHTGTSFPEADIDNTPALSHHSFLFLTTIIMMHQNIEKIIEFLKYNY